MPVALAGGLGTAWGMLRNRGRPAECEDWWTDPENGSDASALWQRAWNPDWDGRAPPSGVEVKTSGQIRHLLFIRHGQYNVDDDANELTDLGREQAAKLGQRLLAERLGVKKDRYGEIKVRYRGIWVSTVIRARQTAEILSAYLPDVPLHEPEPLLAEGMPGVPHPPSLLPASYFPLKKADYWVESARLEAGFRKSLPSSFRVPNPCKLKA